MNNICKSTAGFVTWSKALSTRSMYVICRQQGANSSRLLQRKAQ
jgi:hypothetical protein